MLVTHTKDSTNAVTMVQIISLTMKHRLHKKLVLLCEVAVGSVCRLGVDCSPSCKCSTAMDGALKHVF